ncbi:hypothetical protein KA005_78670 [bacterium]|nr:hypothetical protein [bacterium]
MSLENRKSKITQVCAGIVTLAFVVIGTVGLFSELKNYAREPWVWPYICTLAGLAGLFELVPKIPGPRVRVGARVFFSLLIVLVFYLGWDKGTWHGLYESLACDLRLDFCAHARKLRICHAFRPLKFSGLNDQFVRGDLEEPHNWCKQNTNNRDAQLAYFTLTRAAGNQDALTVTYRPISTSEKWAIVANDPLPSQEASRVDPGRLTLPSYDRVTRSPLTFEPCSTSVAIRICGVPRLNRDARTSEGISDTDVEFWNFVSLEGVMVKKKTTRKEPCDANKQAISR